MVRSSSYIWCDGSHVLLKSEGKHKTEQTKDVTLIRSETLKGRSWGKGGLQRNLERPTCLFPDPTSRLSFITLFLNRLWALWSNVLIKTKVGCDLFWPHGYWAHVQKLEDIIIQMLQVFLMRLKQILVFDFSEISAPIILDTYRVIADFEKSTKYEITLHTGDLVEIVEKNENGDKTTESFRVYLLFWILEPSSFPWKFYLPVIVLFCFFYKPHQVKIKTCYLVC